MQSSINKMKKLLNFLRSLFKAKELSIYFELGEFWYYFSGSDLTYSTGHLGFEDYDREITRDEFMNAFNSNKAREIKYS